MFVLICFELLQCFALIGNKVSHFSDYFMRLATFVKVKNVQGIFNSPSQGTLFCLLFLKVLVSSTIYVFLADYLSFIITKTV